MNNFNEILVVAGVFFNQDKVLAALRPPFKLSGGLWEFPGGKVEAGETLEESLTRELLEELNVSAQVLDRIGQSQYEVEGKAIKMILFEVVLTDGIFEAKEHTQLRWVSQKEFADLNWAPLDVPLLKDVRTVLIDRATNRTDI